MKKVFLITVTVIALMACKNKQHEKGATEQKEETVTPVEAEPEPNEKACLYSNGRAESTLKQTCIELVALDIKLNPLLDGAMTGGDFAYVLFNEDQTKAEIFLPQHDAGIILNKTNTGNWKSGDYRLISWKGYVIQHHGKAVFGG